MTNQEFSKVIITQKNLNVEKLRVNVTLKQKTKLKVDFDKIYNENCLDTMAKMPDNFLDLVITSPPYDNLRRYEGNTFCEFEQIAAELYRVIKAGGVAVWIVGDQAKKGDESGSSFKHALFFKKIGFNLFDTMIYLKPPRGAVGNNKTYWQTFEYMFVLSKGLPKTINLLMDRENKNVSNSRRGTKRLYDGSLKTIRQGGYQKKGRRTNVWQYNVGKVHSATDSFAHKHPAIFPEKLAEDHILSWSDKNDIVYDPFTGSGTTAKMATLNKRHYIGSEISRNYYKLANDRIKDCQVQMHYKFANDRIKDCQVQIRLI